MLCFAPVIVLEDSSGPHIEKIAMEGGAHLMLVLAALFSLAGTATVPRCAAADDLSQRRMGTDRPRVYSTSASDRAPISTSSSLSIPPLPSGSGSPSDALASCRGSVVIALVLRKNTRMRRWICLWLLISAAVIVVAILCEGVLHIPLAQIVQGLIAEPGVSPALAIVIVLSLDLFLPIPSSLVQNQATFFGMTRCASHALIGFRGRGM